MHADERTSGPGHLLSSARRLQAFLRRLRFPRRLHSRATTTREERTVRRAQVVTAACAALMWTAAAGVPMAAAQSGGSGAGSGAGSTQGSNQGGSSTGATAAPTSIGDRGAQTGTGTTATGAPGARSAANELQQFVQKATIANMAEIQLGQ